VSKERVNDDLTKLRYIGCNGGHITFEFTHLHTKPTHPPAHTKNYSHFCTLKRRERERERERLRQRQRVSETVIERDKE
jgi:hypothetical protein